MRRNLSTITSAVVCLALSVLLIYVIVYQQLQIGSLVAQKDQLQESLNETRAHEASLSAEREHFNRTVMFFDKSVYFPDQEVFWNKNDSAVPLTLIVLDKNANLDSVTAELSSSCDTKQIVLHRAASGVFTGSVRVLGLGLNETSTKEGVFKAGFGDRIRAVYGQIDASALFAFPKPPGEDGDYSYWNSWVFDPKGVPLVNYGGSTGLQYNPVFVGGYALANYGEYLNTGNTSYRQKFFSMADWFVETAQQKGNFNVWEYNFAWPWSGYNVTVPYISALAQGVGLSVLIRAYFLSGNLTYLEIGKSAMLSFGIEMRDGGVKYVDADGIWYEELADQGAISGKVLNGFLSALINLYEYYLGSNDILAYTLFLQGARSLSGNLEKYDTGSWSLYDLRFRSRASLDYHKMHIVQLKVMYELTGDQKFLEYSNRFQSYLA